MNVFSALPPSLRRSLLILFTSGLLFWASLASLLPTLSLYLKDVGASNQEIGIVMGAFAIGLLAFRPWVGRMVDLRGRRLVLLIGMTAAAIAPLGYLITQSIPLLIGIRIFHGLSIAAFTTAYSALVVDLSPEHQRGELIGYMTLVNPIGVAIGPAIGGLLQEWAGYTPLFLLAAGLGLVGLIGVACLHAPPSVSAEERVQPKQNRIFWRLALSRPLQTPILVMLLVGLAFGTLSTFVPLFIQETGVDFNAGLFYTAAAIASFSARLLTGRASDRYGRGRFITISLIFYTLAMLMLFVANSPIVFLLAGLLEGAGAGIVIPLIIVLVADRTHAEARGRVFSLTMTGFDLGMAIAGPVLGYFAEVLGYRSLFGIAGGLVCFAILLFICRSNKTLAHSIHFALGDEKDLYALPKA